MLETEVDANGVEASNFIGEDHLTCLVVEEVVAREEELHLVAWFVAHLEVESTFGAQVSELGVIVGIINQLTRVCGLVGSLTHDVAEGRDIELRYRLEDEATHAIESGRCLEVFLILEFGLLHLAAATFVVLGAAVRKTIAYLIL